MVPLGLADRLSLAVQTDGEDTPPLDRLRPGPGRRQPRAQGRRGGPRSRAPAARTPRRRSPIRLEKRIPVAAGLAGGAATPRRRSTARSRPGAPSSTHDQRLALAARPRQRRPVLPRQRRRARRGPRRAGHAAPRRHRPRPASRRAARRPARHAGRPGPHRRGLRRLGRRGDGRAGRRAADVGALRERVRLRADASARSSSGPASSPRRTTSCRPRPRSCPGLVPLRRGADPAARAARSACPAPARRSGRSILRSTRPRPRRRPSGAALDDGHARDAPATSRRSSRRRRSRPGRRRRMSRQAISTGGAPAAIGPYSQAIRSGDMVFCSGQLGLDPVTGELAEGVEAQAERALRNLAVGPRRGGPRVRRRRQDDDLPRRHRRLRGGQRGLRQVHARSAAGPLDGPGRGPAEGRPRRDRGDRPARPGRRRSPAAGVMDADRRSGARRAYVAGPAVIRASPSTASPTPSSMLARPTAAGRRARSSTTPPTAR